MQREKFQSYSLKHIHFYDLEVPELLKKVQWNRDRGDFSILDLGCGNGRVLFACEREGLLNDVTRIIGVDLSPERIRLFKKNVRNVTGIVSDACNVKLLDNQSFDVVICSQLIEHVPSDVALIKEIGRLAKEDGYVYVSSVVRKWYGVYIYRNYGEFRLDPTHLREYESEEEFLDLLQRNGLKVVDVRLNAVSFSILDLLIRLLIQVNLVNPTGLQDFFLRHELIVKLRTLLKVRIFGYYTIEVLAKTRG